MLGILRASAREKQRIQRLAARESPTIESFYMGFEFRGRARGGELLWPIAEAAVEACKEVSIVGRAQDGLTFVFPKLSRDRSHFVDDGCVELQDGELYLLFHVGGFTRFVDELRIELERRGVLVSFEEL